MFTNTTGDNPSVISAYDRIHLSALQMTDMLSEGMIGQFSEKFKYDFDREHHAGKDTEHPVRAKQMVSAACLITVPICSTYIQLRGMAVALYKSQGAGILNLTEWKQERVYETL